MLVSGRITATGTIDGNRQRIDPRSWWLASLRPPLAEATLTVFDPPGAGIGKVQLAAEITTEGTRAIDPATALDPGRVRKIRAEEVMLDRAEWDRLLSCLEAARPPPPTRGERPAAASAGSSKESRATSELSTKHNDTLDLPQFVETYIRANSSPTQTGLEKQWLADSHSGQRDQLRDEFKKQMGEGAPKRGRPKKILGSLL
jgi:hypothetical protein